VHAGHRTNQMKVDMLGGIMHYRKLGWVSGWIYGTYGSGIHYILTHMISTADFASNWHIHACHANRQMTKEVLFVNHEWVAFNGLGWVGVRLGSSVRG
jgi:hypothetical protein